MLRVEVERDRGQAGVALFGADGGMVAAWVQPDHEGHRIGLSRSHDGEVALVVVDAVMTAVRLPDGHFRRERPSGARLPLAGALPARVIARFESTPRTQIAIAP